MRGVRLSAWLLAAWLLAAGKLRAQAGLPQEEIEVTGSLARFHGLTIDKEHRNVTFSASLNLDKGLLEYLLVTGLGKTHESLLSTKIRPEDLQVAMLLLGMKAAPESSAEPPAQINRQYLKKIPPLTGPQVDLFIAWRDKQGAEHRVRAEQLIFDTAIRARMAEGPWIYNGSAVFEGRFLAQVDGSIVALVRDPSAQINNPRPGSDDDQIWEPNPDMIPPAGTAVDFTIQLEDRHP